MQPWRRLPVMSTAGLLGTSLSMVRQHAAPGLPRDQQDFSPVLAGMPQGPLSKAELSQDETDILVKFTVATRRPFCMEQLRQDEVPGIIADPEFLRHLRLITLPGEMLFFDKRPAPGAPPKKKSKRKHLYHLSIFPDLDPDMPEQFRANFHRDATAYARMGCPPCRPHAGPYDLRRGWLEPINPEAPTPDPKPFTAADFASDLARFDRAQADERFPYRITRDDYAALLTASAGLLRAVPTGVYLKPDQRSKPP